MTTALALTRVSCGRIDDHGPHEWIRPRLVCVPGPVRYLCAGPGRIEGGAR